MAPAGWVANPKEHHLTAPASSLSAKARPAGRSTVYALRDEEEGTITMMKLYRRVNERISAYHEAWVDDSKVVEHWGRLGERGTTRDHPFDTKLTAKENLERVLTAPLADGLGPIDDDDHAVLVIEYKVDGMGSRRDLEKRHALQDRLDETLGWTGLGHCDGGSIGSGSMEICCIVVDPEVAKRVVEQDLRDTEFADYSRIFEE